MLNAITFHQYYMNGRTATLADFLNPDIYDLLGQQVQYAKAIRGNIDRPLWITETASAYGGGAPGYSDRYVGVFIWVDKLGLTAKKGIELVMRQSIFKGHYALLDEEYNARPDWWVSVLYKKLVGQEVVDCSSPVRSVRIYCHCAMNSSSPAVTVFGVNLQDSEANVRIQGADNVLAYILTPYDNLLSKYVRLNGEILYTMNGGYLPELKGRSVSALPHLVMPPYSVAFWVVPLSSSSNLCN